MCSSNLIGIAVAFADCDITLFLPCLAEKFRAGVEKAAAVNAARESRRCRPSIRPPLLLPRLPASLLVVDGSNELRGTEAGRQADRQAGRHRIGGAMKWRRSAVTIANVYT